MLSDSFRVETIDAPDDLDAATAALVLANVEDPVVRWVFDTPLRMLTYATQLFRVLVANAFASAALQRTDDGLAVACWRPPGVHHDDGAIAAILQQGCAPDKLETFGGVAAELERYEPEGPFWYLSALGVDPAAQNRGRGALLLQARLAQCDAARLPAYLWSSNERNVPFYERHGFEVQTMLRVSTCPPMIPMVRRAR
ncbi:GNAT family N-acetyltransferase [Paraburkholderia sp. SARCC-3016]|uniref:GNAT family N-acetyltransferase n=1 Tax=Paraburkholderia sp. SARCC-3016 TaxID=3058611 RepID=UPI002808FED1|nr:GNAT family N-acetyltransferase [Paraburkholderia sp. SARCC-3016]MDQ7977099.1 GNAT family N-acetyltransferase [Paraburkholderia sp. SARCC-3016]